MSDKSENIDFYFDFLSSYGYMGSCKIDELAARFGRQVTWRPILLGITIFKVMGLKAPLETPLKGDYIHIDSPRMAKYLGVPYKHPAQQPNPLNSARAYYWLRQRDANLAKDLAKALLARQWAQGIDISSAELVADEAAALGVERQETLAALQDPAVKQLLADAVDQAIAEGVFGSPFFVVDGEHFWGVDRLPLVEHWLEHGSW